MTLREALQDVISHPCKRGLRTTHGVFYYDPSFGDDCLRRTPVPKDEWVAIGFGMSLFSMTDVLYDKHVVIDINFVPFKDLL